MSFEGNLAYSLYTPHSMYFKVLFYEPRYVELSGGCTACATAVTLGYIFFRLLLLFSCLGLLPPLLLLLSCSYCASSSSCYCYCCSTYYSSCSAVIVFLPRLLRITTIIMLGMCCYSCYADSPSHSNHCLDSCACSSSDLLYCLLFL